MNRALQLIGVAIMLLGFACFQAIAQDDTELAKKTQNPVADLISVPLQNNWNFGAGVGHDKTIYVLNI